MDKITNTIELKNLLSRTRFTVNYYQREYRWGRKQIEQLIEDLASAFENNYNNSIFTHESTKEVKEYGYYYMGSIIRTNEQNNKEIIDGQQRLTSISLLLIFINNIFKRNNTEFATKVVTDMICSDSFGETNFNLDVPERKICFENLFNDNKNFIPNNESSMTMLQRYQDIEEIFPQELLGEALPYFTYWLIEKVLFMEIITPSEQDAHKVFVTMNDRGLSLNSAEMLKGFLLSEIKDDEDRNLANKVWKETIKKIKDSYIENTDGAINSEDVNFISTWLRGNYADTMRDTKKGAKDEDYEIIGSEFHQWVRSNAKKMGLNKSKNYKDFICIEMEICADIYINLKKYSKTLTKDFEEVFYNSNRELNYQTMMVFSAIDWKDTEEIRKLKIKLVTTFVDIFASIRMFNFKKFNFNSNKSILFRIIKAIRNKTSVEIARILFKEIKQMNLNVSALRDLELNQFTGRYMLHILSRLTSYINIQMNNPSQFDNYVNRTSRNSYDIEHIFPDKFDDYKNLFNSEAEFYLSRAKIGNLIILTKDKNRSYQDMNVEKKLSLYFGDNVLAQSLSQQAYVNNPGFLKLSFEFKFYKTFSKEAIQERSELYCEIAEDIWDLNKLKTLVGGWTETKEENEEFCGRDFVVEYNNRNWEDAKNFGFVSAGGNRLRKLEIGDRIFCHKASKGYLGVGICVASAVKISEFEVEGKKLMECDLQDKNLILKTDEIIVKIKWQATVEDEELGFWESGLISLPSTVYQLNTDYTYKKVLEYFGVE